MARRLLLRSYSLWLICAADCLAKEAHRTQLRRLNEDLESTGAPPDAQTDAQPDADLSSGATSKSSIQNGAQNNKAVQTGNETNVKNNYEASCLHGQDAHTAYELGGMAVLCVFVSSRDSKGVLGQKQAFRVKVDEYASLTLRGSFAKAMENTNSAPTYTWTAMGGSKDAAPQDCASTGTAGFGVPVSCPQLYMDGGKVVPFVNLVVNLNRGVIQSLVWDNMCAGCLASDCELSSSALDADLVPVGGPLLGADMCASTAGSKVQDLKVFVTWAGTDSNGLVARSATLRFTQFAGYSLGDMWKWTQSVYDDLSEAYYGPGQSEPTANVFEEDDASSKTTSNKGRMLDAIDGVMMGGLF